MVTTFNKKDMVSFGTYLLSKKREQRLKQTNIENPKAEPYEDRYRFVFDADFANWKQENVNEKSIVEKMHNMCIESLDPELFNNWEKIKEQLSLNRVKLKK